MKTIDKIRIVLTVMLVICSLVFLTIMMIKGYDSELAVNAILTLLWAIWLRGPVKEL